MNPLIQFKNVSFQYHSQSSPTLHDISVSINQGEKILVVGPSGSGKSTFANCINGLIPHIHEGELTGEVIVNGTSVKNSQIAELSFEVGTVLQDTDGQFIGLTVAEDVAFSLENECVEQSVIKQRVLDMATTVSLESLLSHRPQELSGGQKQRVSMAGVLIDQIPVLLLDEPLANLDPKTGKESMVLLDEICADNKTTVVIVEHRLEDVLYRHVDRVIVFDEGRIIADLPPIQLLQSDLLERVGIREPLYVSAMKYAGVDLLKTTDLDSLESVEAPFIRETMEAWSTSVSLPVTESRKKPLLSLKDLNFKYGKNGKPVFNDLSVTLYQGEMVSIVGKNGAGKSTLCKAICGFIQPQGEMTWSGQDFMKQSIKERADYVGFVMQNPNQMISKKMIVDEVGLGLLLRGVAEAEIKERVAAILKVCGLYEFRNWPISALSFGQKKRVTIASILVLNPQMILLDEPTAGQDLRHYTEMMEFLQRISDQGVTVGMVTHDMHLMLEYTERALVIGEGHVIADTTPTKVLTNPQLIERASLKETSLFRFASRIGLADPINFTEKFISYDREARLK
ncbi:ABC transporter ATP-binding protein [uncultured Vagococcus sp.]|uniref:ABC transporter ATP-binding protein n=1 Tax=uncultured Vagococcus sp. TaxID=189676 RepID=UPI0028D12566|nr:ABC transporter ATP-binding protein [uncultured Vagococcus sp.]